MENRNNCYISLGIFAFALVGFIYTTTMSPSAAKYPLFILGITMAFSAVYFLINLLAIQKQKKAGSWERPKREPVFTWKEWAVIGIAIAYAFLLKWIGFIPASLIVFIGLAIFLGYRKWISLGIISIASVAVVWYIFFEYLNLSYISGSLFK